jgi:sugar (pentulose or hexulose) kinase
MVSILTDRPVVSPPLLPAQLGNPRALAATRPRRYGFAVDWFQREFCRELSPDDFCRDYPLRCLDEWAADRAVTFDPYLTGNRQSLEVRVGAGHGLTLASSRDEMVAAR